VALLREELAKHMDVDAVVRSFGQVAAATRREEGELFSLREHMRGVILAMLSANRPWKPIADSLPQLREVFGGYSPSFLESADPDQLARAVSALKCGNRRMSFQMRAIRPNLEMLRQIDAEFGTLDRYLESHPIEQVVHELASSKRRKLRELGPALVLEYLKNIGIRASKPDVHLLRICGPRRLRILPQGASAIAAFQEFRAFALEADVHEVELDNLVWLLGAEDYANRCGAAPRCEGCSLRPMCRQDA
jgi:hypothetical protein